MKISVIVPIYNAEKFLNKCLDSVLSQTYNDWELILIDDGSIDRSFEIAKKYSENDKRIKAFTQPNGGPGKARNTGIEKATGEYIVFLDCDDYIDKDYFKLLHEKGSKYDVVFIDVLQVDSNGNELVEESMSKYKSLDKEKFQKAMMTGKIPWGGVRKAVKSNFLKENNIKYSNLSIGEEALYSFQLLEKANKIAFLDDKPVYFYVNREGSQSKLKVLDPWGGTVEALKNYLLSNETLYKKYAETLNSFNAVAAIVSIDKISQIYNGKERNSKIKSRIKDFEEMKDESYGFDKISMVKKARVLLPFLNKGIYFPIIFCSKLRNIIK